jgi:hypothetical protein
MFIIKFQGTYEHPSAVKTLKNINQKHNESLKDYMKHFYNARNTIPYIQDNEVINAFHDGVSEIKMVEEIAMKKPKTVADLLTVADVCIEASKAYARLLESRNKGHQGRSNRMIRRSILSIAGIVKTTKITKIANISPQSRRRRGRSIALMM